MSEFIEIKPEELKKNPFEMIGKDWMLITAKKDNEVNTMTASWGGVGVLWNKNVAYIFIRPQRYTKEFVDGADKFSLSFFDESFKKQLGYLGSVSGRDEDKISNSKLKVDYSEDIPYFEEANTVLFCNKLYAQELNPESFILEELDEKNYPGKDYHTMYIAEVEKVIIKK